MPLITIKMFEDENICEHVMVSQPFTNAPGNHLDV